MKQPTQTIHGVQIKSLTTHADDRGYFRELWRTDDGMAQSIAQTSVTMTFPGIIKAFHGHQRQDDIWYVASGTARVVLYDARKNSPTANATQTIVCGQNNPLIIFIPRGVFHGYQVIGPTPVVLVYHTTQAYNPGKPDELRMDWNDATIAYDWTVKNR